MLSQITRAVVIRMYPLFAIAILMTFFGCASTPERHPVPRELTNKVRIPDISEARFWGDEWPKWSRDKLEKFTEKDLNKFFSGIYKKPHNYLAVSGGGANGAFGAGLLVGWTATGTRPEFTMVTGVSTGALTAPFAFLGPDYDHILEEVYTTTSTKDIVKQRNAISALFGESMTDTKPLKAMIAKYFTSDVLNGIAREYKRGRRLYIGTVNLDAGRPVIWNIGAIATSEYPQKLELLHDILRASSAIPVIFPPVLISVENNGERYDELHVDGGTGSQVFVYPAAIDWKQITRKLEVNGDPRVYVIRNAFLEPDYNGIKRKLLPIATRSIDSLIMSQGLGDIYHIYALCQRDGNDFNLAFIPPEFTEEPTESFDPVYMKKLYALGYEMALKGYPWEKTPPRFDLNP